MPFDPLINYGVLDFSAEENLVYWNFSELIKTLITLSKDAGDQLEIMDTNAAAEEMALDFESFYTLSASKYRQYKLLSYDQMDELTALSTFFEEKNAQEDFWTADQLYSNKDWNQVRAKAAELLHMINMDHLDIDVARETTTVEKVGGIKESTSIVQRVLVNK